MICLCATFPLPELNDIEEGTHEYVINIRKVDLLLSAGFYVERINILFSRILQRHTRQRLTREKRQKATVFSSKEARRKK